MTTQIKPFSALCASFRAQSFCLQIKAPIRRGDGFVSVVADFPPSFFKTTISLAFPQIRRENQVLTNVNELQPSVCLLLSFYFPVV
jgi:hypothetical protein